MRSAVRSTGAVSAIGTVARHGVELPAATVEGLRRCHQVESFGRSIARRIATCRALRVADGFREGGRCPSAIDDRDLADVAACVQSPCPGPRVIL